MRILLLLTLVGLLATESHAAANDKRLRVIVTSDFPPFPVTNSDPDDVQSMVRFLLYANEFDVEGLIASAGTHGMVAEKKNILAVLNEYDKVDEHLRRHDPKYPTADALRAVTFEGKGNNHGFKIQFGCGKQPANDILGKGKDSEASKAIIAAADMPDPRPIYIGVWGGPREVAQAIWDVKNTRSEAELKAFLGKLRIFLIACQDATHEWLMKEFPDLFIIESRKTYQGMFGSDSRAWVEENIINNHGPLCAIYPPRAVAGQGVIEGDSPAFLYLVSANRGINDPEDPTQPSWGGQYVRQGATKHFVDGPGAGSIRKWRADFQAEFKERANWCMPTSKALVPASTRSWPSCRGHCPIPMSFPRRVARATTACISIQPVPGSSESVTERRCFQPEPFSSTTNAHEGTRINHVSACAGSLSHEPCLVTGDRHRKSTAAAARIRVPLRAFVVSNRMVPVQCWVTSPANRNDHPHWMVHR